MVDALLVFASEVAGQPGDQRAMQGFEIGWLICGRQLPSQLIGLQQKLPMQFAPFAHAHE